MNFTAQGLYELWYKSATEFGGIEAGKWEELTQDRREAWAHFAMALRDSFRGVAKR